jgi:hypothetical protein
MGHLPTGKFTAAISSFGYKITFAYSRLHRFWPLTLLGRTQHADHSMKKE